VLVAIALQGTPQAVPGASSTATSVTITVPTGSVGDVLFAHIEAGAATAGAVLITAGATGWATLWSVDDTVMTAKVFYRVVQAGDPSTYTFNLNTGVPMAGTMVRYSGVATSTPFRFINATEQGSDNALATTSTTFPGVDNVQSTDLTLCFVANASNTGIRNAQIPALGTPTGWTNVVNSLGPASSSSIARLAMATYSRAAGTDTPTLTTSSGCAASISVVLIDAANVVAPSAGGTISFVNAATTGQSATSGTIVVNVPTGVADGDLLLAAVSNPSGNGTWSNMTGWEEIPNTTNCMESQGTSSNLSDCDAALFYRIASSEPASYTFTNTKSNHGNAGVIVAYRGIRNPYPVHLMNVAKSEGSGNSSTTVSKAPYQLNTLNVINSDMLVVNFYCCGNDVSSGAITFTMPASPWNTRATVSASIAATFNGAVAVTDKLGATDLPTVTASVSSGWVVFSVAIAPAPAAAAGLPEPIRLYTYAALQRASMY
jgi:hypothetical protein